MLSALESTMLLESMPPPASMRRGLTAPG